MCKKLNILTSDCIMLGLLVLSVCTRVRISTRFSSFAWSRRLFRAIYVPVLPTPALKAITERCYSHSSDEANICSKHYVLTY